MYRIANHTCPCSMSNEAGACSASSQSLSLGQYFPGIFLQPRPMGKHPHQDFAWCGQNLPEAWDSHAHYMTFSKGAQDISETPKIWWEWQFSWCAWDFHFYIQQYLWSKGSWIFHVSEKLLHPQILTRQTSKSRQFFYLEKSRCKIRRRDYRKASQLFSGSCLDIILLWSVTSLSYHCSESELKLS